SRECWPNCNGRRLLRRSDQPSQKTDLATHVWFGRFPATSGTRPQMGSKMWGFSIVHIPILRQSVTVVRTAARIKCHPVRIRLIWQPSRTVQKAQETDRQTTARKFADQTHWADPG